MICKCVECGDMFDLPEHLRKANVVTCLNCSLDRHLKPPRSVDEVRASAYDRMRCNILVGDN